MEETAVETLRDTDRREFRAVLDEELGRLPDKYRSPVVLCYLEGLTHEEAAQRLRWPVGTVRSRMAWARDRLRGRLAKRGLALPSALLLSALASETTATPVPPALLDSTIRAAMGLAVAKGATAGIVSASVASLMGEVLKAMYYHKLRSLALGMLAVGTVTGGAVIANLQSLPSQSPAPNADNAAATARADDREDRLADLNDEISRLENEIKILQDRLFAAKMKRAGIRAKSDANRSGSTVSFGTTNSSRTSAASGAPGQTTVSSSATIGASTASAGTATGFGTTSTGSAPTIGLPSGSSISASGSAPKTGLIDVISGASSGSAPSTSLSNGVSVTASGSARSSSNSKGLSVSNGAVVAFVTPNGERVAVHKQGGATNVYRVPKGVRATPIVGASAFVTLEITGDSIPEVAVYDAARKVGDP